MISIINRSSRLIPCPVVPLPIKGVSSESNCLLVGSMIIVTSNSCSKQRLLGAVNTESAFNGLSVFLQFWSHSSPFTWLHSFPVMILSNFLIRGRVNQREVTSSEKLVPSKTHLAPSCLRRLQVRCEAARCLFRITTRSRERMVWFAAQLEMQSLPSRTYPPAPQQRQ